MKMRVLCTTLSMNYNLTFAIKSNEYIFNKIINYYLPTKQDSIVETIMNNDTNVPPVEGLFSVSPLVSKRATFYYKRPIESTYCILTIAHRGLKAEFIIFILYYI